MSDVTIKIEVSRAIHTAEQNLNLTNVRFKCREDPARRVVHRTNSAQRKHSQTYQPEVNTPPADVIASAHSSHQLIEFNLKLKTKTVICLLFTYRNRTCYPLIGQASNLTPFQTRLKLLPCPLRHLSHLSASVQIPMISVVEMKNQFFRILCETKQLLDLNCRPFLTQQKTPNRHSCLSVGCIFRTAIESI